MNSTEITYWFITLKFNVWEIYSVASYKMIYCKLDKKKHKKGIVILPSSSETATLVNANPL